MKENIAKICYYGQLLHACDAVTENLKSSSSQPGSDKQVRDPWEPCNLKLSVCSVWFVH